MEAVSDKNESNSQDNKSVEAKTVIPFKKPLLIGKIGRFPKKISPINNSDSSEKSKETIETEKDAIESPKDAEQQKKETQSQNPLNAPSQQLTENHLPLPYKEPIWSGLPESIDKAYSFEVLKNGAIIETIDLMTRPYWVFGRITSCNICMQHPTISRFHAVLQYRKDASETEGSGFYLYDLGSTHGTFLNRNRLKPKVYVRMQVGHMLKLGCSTRSYLLTGPEYDEEEESELSVTELKQKREEERQKHKLESLKLEKEKEERKKREEEKGVDWGLGEDADEETDLSENPFAQTNNEELYLDDPKKALRGFFEREGLDLDYDCTEQGMGQFLCKVELPVDDEMGRPIVAEVLHKGKKKEAVVQCALEACKILDRYGVLRQATHESRKRKSKNWEENDFYDSDEDTFLDRTGTIEKKREKRMNSKAPQTVETYESLLEKEKSLSASISAVEAKLTAAQKAKHSSDNQNTEEDSLDSYMKELKQSKADKQSVNKLKVELTKLKGEHARISRLLDIAKPASLPSLSPQNTAIPSTSKQVNAFPIIGKRKKIKMQLPEKPPDTHVAPPNCDMNDEEEEEEEEDEDEVGNERETQKAENVVEGIVVSNTSDPDVENEDVSEPVSSSSSTISDEEEARSGGCMSIKCLQNIHTHNIFKKFEKILQKDLPPFVDKHQEKLEKVLNNLKKLATSEDRMHVDWKMLAAKKRKVMKLISDMKNCEPNDRLEHKVSSELNRILSELNTMTEQKLKVVDKVKKMGTEIKNISEAIDKDFKEHKREIEMIEASNSSKMESAYSQGTSSGPKSFENKEAEANLLTSRHKKSITDDLDASKSHEEEEEDMDVDGIDDRKKKKNKRRIQQRQERAEVERQREYEEDARRENYSMWVPPSDQSGDGRTSLNDKYGY